MLCFRDGHHSGAHLIQWSEKFVGVLSSSTLTASHSSSGLGVETGSGIPLEGKICAHTQKVPGEVRTYLGQGFKEATWVFWSPIPVAKSVANTRSQGHCWAVLDSTPEGIPL